MNSSSVKKWPHICLTALVAAYLTFVFLSETIIGTIASHDNIYETPSLLAVYLLVVAVFFMLCYFLLHLLSKNIKVLFTHDRQKTNLSPVWFSAVALSVFVFYLLYWAAHYPGGSSPDTSWQWEQAHSLNFNDHHPFFHTFLFLILTSIWDSYTFLLLIQIAAFACALGYLAATMRAWGFQRSIILILCAVIALNTSTRKILLFFWKDTAMSIFFLFFLSHIFNLVLTRGEWLKSTSHWLASAALLACITLVRHNAILFTAPLLILMLVYLANVRRACLKLILAVLILVLGVKGPLQSTYHVTPAEDSYLETTGLPMTILCSAYALAPETMPEEAYQFMERFADQNTVARQYQFGNYNSVKWSLDFTQEILAQTPLNDFLSLTLETAKSYPILAVQTVLELTDMVWDPLGAQYHLTDPVTGTPASFVAIPEEIQTFCSELFTLIDGVLDGHIFQKLSSQLGVLILGMLVACYVSIHNFRGWPVLWLILPIMCYNFGTMLLLCGNDYRFFHFNCLAAWPLVVLMLSRPRKAENETCK